MRLALVMTAALATRAHAAPWADWVGDYRGALSWSSCTTNGAASATLALDAIDGAMAIDLTRAGRALRPLSLVEDDAGWSARDGDLTVAITRPRPNAIRLVVAYDSGCTLRATLVRTRTAHAHCDRLDGWTRIAKTCSKTDAELPPSTKWRLTDGPACHARAERLELALIDAGCAPHPEGNLATRSADCSALAARAAALSRCGTVPLALRDPYVRHARALISASRTAERSTLSVVEQQCRDASATLAALATRHRCP